MPNDEWLEDVRRWYYGGNPPADETTDPHLGATAAFDVGYEAAHPALQARHWPDAQTVRAEGPTP